MSTVKKYAEVPVDWSRTINEAVAASRCALEDLVFVKRADGTLQLFDKTLDNVEKKSGHCVVVLGVSAGSPPAISVTYVMPLSCRGEERGGT